MSNFTRYIFSFVAALIMFSISIYIYIYSFFHVNSQFTLFFNNFIKCFVMFMFEFINVHISSFVCLRLRHFTLVFI